MNQEKPLLAQLVESLQCLPGVGRKTAQRMAYQLLDKERDSALHLAEVLQQSMQSIGNCQSCRDYTEQALCRLCQNSKRNDALICIVETPADIAAMESTASFSGKYFVLMGNLSPLDGIGPDEIGLNLLAERVRQHHCDEIIVATSSTVEGEATAHFIKSMVAKIDANIIVSRLAQGVPIGGELEYLDSSTLSLSLANRQSI
jgi:recombination protein RecR